MAEYIEREAAIDAAIEAHNIIDNNPCQNIRDCINAIPAADVVPVRHGRWRKAVGTSGIVRMSCTNCGFMRFPENDSREPMFAYCPRCGARMDGDGE